MPKTFKKKIHVEFQEVSKNKLKDFSFIWVVMLFRSFRFSIVILNYEPKMFWKYVL